MTTREFKETFGVDAGEVDAIEALEHHHFDRNAGRSYEQAAIDDCVAARVGFHTTANNCHTMLHRYVQVVCPVCGKVLKLRSSGGCTGSYSGTFECRKCGVEVSVPVTGMSVYFRDRKRG